METSGNPTLDNNLKCIARYNPKLAQDLLDLPNLTSDIELIETKLNEPNLRYNFIPLHSQEGAEAEAKRIFEDARNTPSSVHVVFGIGIGHLFKECCDNSKGVILLLEPNFDILRVTLELVDFSNELSQKNVFVVSDLDSLKQYCLLNSSYKANSTFLALDSYKTYLYHKEMTDLMDRIKLIVGTCVVRFNTSIRFEKDAADMLLKNIPYLLDTTPVNEFKDIYKGKTALVVSAGPSLDANIETIKKNRDKVVIFCVGTALKSLMSNDITPEFVNILENQECSGQIRGCDLSNINLITDTYTSNSVYQLKVKKNLLFPSRNNIGYFWSYLTGVSVSPYIARGTVSYEALESAKMVGCSKIILVGQDLAYSNNQCYSQNASSSDMVFELNPETNKPEFKIVNKERLLKTFLKTGPETSDEEREAFIEQYMRHMNSNLFYIKGITGEMLPTNKGYATFIEHFASFANENPDLELINTSLIGAQLDGFENLPLNEALKGSETIETVKLDSDFKYDKKYILEKIDETSYKFKATLLKIMDAKKHLSRYRMDEIRKKITPQSAISYFTIFLDLFDDITLNEKNFLFQAISFNERVEVQHESREAGKLTLDNTRDEKFKRLHESLKDFFIKVEEKVLITLEELEKTRGILNEGFDTKSEEGVGIN